MNKRIPLVIFIALVITFLLLFFEEPITRLGPSFVTLFRNYLPIVAAIVFIIQAIHDSAYWKKLLSPYFICGSVFAISGIIGWIPNNYQTFSITAQTMYEHLRFWLCLYLFMEVFRLLPMEKYAKTFFFK